MDEYLDDFSKMVLVVESLKEYKTNLIIEKGIGEDLTFNLFGWSGDYMKVVAQLSPSLMEDKVDRIRRVLIAAFIFRQGFGCDAISFGAEGYCVLEEGEYVDGIPLNEQFSTNSDVLECITVLHVGKEIDMAAVPYRYAVGRKVIFGNPVRNADPYRLEIITESLVEILGADATNPLVGQPQFTRTLVNGMQKDGFEVTVIEE